MLAENCMLVDVGKSRRDGMSVEDDKLVNVDKSRRACPERSRGGWNVEQRIIFYRHVIPTGFLLGDELISTDMSSLRDFSEQRIDFYQHFVPNGTKIERKYFYANITFLTSHP
jgi:hypothetical protein